MLIFWIIAVVAAALVVWGWRHLGKKKVRTPALKKELPPSYIEGARMRAAERAEARAAGSSNALQRPQQTLPPAPSATPYQRLAEHMEITTSPVTAPPASLIHPEPVPEAINPKEEPQQATPPAPSGTLYQRLAEHIETTTAPVTAPPVPLIQPEPVPEAIGPEEEPQQESGELQRQTTPPTPLYQRLVDHVETTTTPVSTPPQPTPPLKQESEKLSLKEKFQKELQEHNKKISDAIKQNRKSAHPRRYSHPNIIASKINEFPEKDVWESGDVDLYGEDGKILRKTDLRISYRDREGNITNRDVDVQRYAYRPDRGIGSMIAFCHMRKANRTFLFSGIKQSIDLETGEVISSIGAYLDSLYQQTPKYAVKNFIDGNKAPLFILFCMAKADGVMRSKERSVIADYANKHGLTDFDAQDELLTQMKQWEANTRNRFHQAVREAKSEMVYDLEDLLEACIQIIQTDKTIHSDEIRMLNYAATHWELPLPDGIRGRQPNSE